MPIRKYYNQNWLPSIFNDFFDNDWMEKTNATAPAINVIESEKNYKVEVAAPGMTKDDLKTISTSIWEMTMNLLFLWKRKLKTKIRIKKTRNTCDASSLTQNSNSHFTCLTMLIRKR